MLHFIIFTKKYQGNINLAPAGYTGRLWKGWNFIYFEAFYFKKKRYIS